MAARLQFSLRSVLIFWAVLALMLGINLQSSVTHGEIWFSIFQPRGESNLRDWVSVERGFPLPFQQVTKHVELGTAELMVANGWPRSEPVPLVTHPHWLLADVGFAMLLAILGGWAAARIAKFGSTLRRTQPGKTQCGSVRPVSKFCQASIKKP